jgi:ribonuclease HIII
MASFAAEEDVRSKFQMTDLTLAPSALILASIDDAHAELLRVLDPTRASEPPDANLVMGEVMLAGAHLFRSLASKDALGQRQVVIGSQRIDAGKRFGALMAMASLAEQNAWYLLEPYLVDRPSRAPLAPTETSAVLGEA